MPAVVGAVAGMFAAELVTTFVAEAVFADVMASFAYKAVVTKVAAAHVGGLIGGERIGS